MNKKWKGILILVGLFLISNLIQAQVVTEIKDTTSLQEKKETQKESASQANSNSQNREGLNNENNQQPGQEGQTGIKRVRSARPDMSKARGARPPQIVRPSGSGVPKVGGVFAFVVNVNHSRL